MKKVIVMSGVSGSGKTTHAHHLMQNYLDSIGINPRTHEEYHKYLDPNSDSNHLAKVSADDYFIGEDGVYKFDPTKIGLAHDKCFYNYIEALQFKIEFVVVDNTNCSNEEIAPYMLGASAFGYEAEIITLAPILDIDLVDISYGERERYILKCAERNSHGATYEVIMKQFNALFNRFLLPWWENTNIRVKF